MQRATRRQAKNPHSWQDEGIARNRERACEAAGVEPRYKTVAVDDPVAYVMSKNLHRRHLAKSQLGLAAGRAQKLREKYEEAAKERQREAAHRAGVASGAARRGETNVQKIVTERSPTPQSRDLIAAQFGISGPTVDRGRRVVEKGVPELIQAVEAGRMSVNKAAEIAKLPKEEQTRELAGEKKEEPMGVMKQIATRQAKYPRAQALRKRHRKRSSRADGKWLHRLMRSKIGGPCEVCNAAIATRTVWKRSLRHGGKRNADNLMGVCGVCEMDWRLRQGG